MYMISPKTVTGYTTPLSFAKPPTVRKNEENPHN
jgi:hypothetical protein